MYILAHKTLINVKAYWI